MQSNEVLTTFKFVFSRIFFVRLVKTLQNAFPDQITLEWSLVITFLDCEFFCIGIKIGVIFLLKLIMNSWKEYHVNNLTIHVR